MISPVMQQHRMPGFFLYSTFEADVSITYIRSHVPLKRHMEFMRYCLFEARK